MTPHRSPLAIIPAWNEAPVIAETVRELRAVRPDVHILVVSDGSTDDTAELARRAGADTVLELPFNLGVGGAMRTGYRYAQRHGYECAFQLDADGQHDPREIERLLTGLGSADISIGARFAGRGDYQTAGPRRWAMRLLADVLSRVARTRLTDVTSGFRAANRRAIEQYARHYPTEYLGDTVDSLMTAARAGLTVTQVPIAMRPRQGGTPSSSPWKSAVYLGRSLFALLVAATRRAGRVVP